MRTRIRKGRDDEAADRVEKLLWAYAQAATLKSLRLRKEALRSDLRASDVAFLNANWFPKERQYVYL